MSLTNPNNLDDLVDLLDTYFAFLCDPKVRANVELVKYFFDLTDQTLELWKMQVLSGK